MSQGNENEGIFEKKSELPAGPPLPASEPTVARSVARSSMPAKLGCLMVGVFLGALAASLVWGLILLRSPWRANGPAEQLTESNQTVLQLGKAFIADLENQRLASAYRSTTESYQRNLERPAFDAFIAKHPNLRRLQSFGREEKARKAADGKAWEYYFTGRTINTPQGRDLVNVALVYVQEKNLWKISGIEITSEDQK